IISRGAQPQKRILGAPSILYAGTEDHRARVIWEFWIFWNWQEIPHGGIVDPNNGEVQAGVRARQGLRGVCHAGGELRLADITERTSLHRTTAFRLLQSLAHGGLIERTARGVYRCRIQLSPPRRFRLGFAAQTDSVFARDVTESLQRAAGREKLELVT